MIKKYQTFMLVTILFSVLAALVILGQFFFPALLVGEKVSGAEFAYKSYTGFNVAILYWPQWVPGKQLIGPNPLLIAALLLPLIGTLVCGCMWKKAGFTRRIVLSAILAALYLYFAVCFLNITETVMPGAFVKFREMIYDAQQKGMFRPAGYAIFASVTAITVAALHIAAIVLNIRMKKDTKVEVTVAEE